MWSQGKWFALLGLSLLAGCGGPVPVEGRVTLDGKPLDEALVTFIHETGDYHGSNATDSEGRFHLGDMPGDNVRPGKYRVVVSKLDTPKEGIDDAKGGTSAYGKNMAAYMRAIANAKELVPLQYTDPSKTPLTFDIPRGGVKDLEVALTTGSR